MAVRFDFTTKGTKGTKGRERIEDPSPLFVPFVLFVVQLASGQGIRSMAEFQ